MGLLATLLSIAISFGLSYAMIKIQERQAEDKTKESVDKGTATHQIQQSVNDILKEAEQKGSDTLSKVTRQIESVQSLQPYIATGVAKQIIQKASRAAQDKQQQYEKSVNEFTRESENAKTSAAYLGAMSDSFRNSATGQAEIKRVKQQAADAASKFEKSIKEI